jgi:hypothetical protein
MRYKKKGDSGIFRISPLILGSFITWLLFPAQEVVTVPPE